ncbi:MAG: serine/threonine protein kinase, partial [Myxococcales bacterium]|nr:serine/threonine protein kinase [Myxococcales bacterium]
MSREAADSLAERLTSDRYQVAEEIGRGGMATVFAAVDRDLRRPVAVKVLDRSMASSTTLRQRFLREARAAARLKNDHVVRVFDVGALDDGQPWMVMERLEGCDLRQRMGTGRLPIEEAVDIVLQACIALSEAHAVGLVHRDLKPSNLFLTAGPDGTTRVKVLDFGIAKALGRDSEMDLTGTGEMLGSPRYMSPEQLRGSAELDARSDVWALGVVLYELLADRPPFAGATVAELCASILERKPAPFHGDTSAPLELQEVVLRCLHKDAAARYPSAVALAEALAPFGSAQASGYLLAARGYDQRTSDVRRITAPSLGSAGPIESIVDTAPPAAPPPAPPSSRRALGLETDPTWDAAVPPPRRRLGGLILFGAGVALALAVLLVALE